MLQTHQRGSVTQFVTFANISQNWLGPLPIQCHHIVILYPQPMVKIAFCDLSHTFHKPVTNVLQHAFIILLWGILTSSLPKRLYILRLSEQFWYPANSLIPFLFVC